jgi:hypothetical protein
VGLPGDSLGKRKINYEKLMKMQEFEAVVVVDEKDIRSWR